MKVKLQTVLLVFCVWLSAGYGQGYNVQAQQLNGNLLASNASMKSGKSNSAKPVTTLSLNDALEIIYNRYQIRIVSNHNQTNTLQIEADVLNSSNDKIVSALSRYLQGKNLHLQKMSPAKYMILKPLQPTAKKYEAGVAVKVTGVVKDDFSQPMPAVTVRVIGTNRGTTTTLEGKYSIEAEHTDTLEFSFMGYKKNKVLVGNQLIINVVMEPAEGSLQEVTIVGFGKQKKVSVVGAIQTIKPADLRVPTSNLSNAFAGKMAGVVAFQRSGEPGADGASFYIRGISTFSGATSPLIVLDGVAVSQGDLNALAPEVIESFSILKDATATAIYGSRGANGVMIVTTKSGKDLDKPKINLRIENSVSTPTTVPEFVEGARFMELYNEAVTGRSTGEVLYSKDRIDGTRAGSDPNVYPNVDWYDELFKDHAMNRSVNLNVMGGGKRIDYFMSATLNHDNGLLKKFNVNSYDNNISVKRYSFQNNLNANLSPSTKLALKINTQLRDYHGPAKAARDVFGDVMNANAVDFPVMFTGTEQLQFGGKTGGRFNDGFQNPFAEMVKGYNDSFESTLVTTLDGEQKLDFLTNGLTFKGLASFKNFSSTGTTRSRGYNQFQVTNLVNDNGKYVYDLSMVGNTQNETLATSNSTNGDRTLYFQTTLDYNKTIAAKHNISAMVLYNQQEYNGNAPASLISSLPKRVQGFAGRFTYGFDNKYFTEFNFGYNGSENFEQGNRFGFFPSAAAGYLVSNEKFFEPLLSTVSMLKLRGSWGLVGNDQIYLPDGSPARFVYLSDINLNGQGYTTGVDQNYTRNGPSYLRFANSNISWEVAEKINVGMDMELFNNLNIVVDVFKENRSSIFLERAIIPESFGTLGTRVYGNLGKVLNKGFDISLDYSYNPSPDFSAALKGTFTFARNKVLEIDEPVFSRYKNLSRVGYPVNSQLGYDAERLFVDQAEINANPLQQLGGFVQPGDIKYRDLTNNVDGMNMINSDDRIRMGHPTVPEIVYGFGPSFKYKKIDFSFFFQGVANTSFFINNFHPFGSSEIRNVLQFVDESHWSPADPNVYASYPRLSKLNNPNNTPNSSYWLRSGAFLKLRNVEMGYSYKKIARLYLSGFNVMTFSKFKLWDPEQGGGNGLGYPTQRTFNIGLQMGF